jgi:adenosylcobinamide-phosphate synthase
MSLPLTVLAAVLLDKLLGEPRRWHPLVGFGRLAQWLERRLRRKDEGQSTQRIRVKGLFALLLLVMPFTMAAFLLSRIPLWGAVLEVFLLYLAIGAASLKEHAQAVRHALLKQDIDDARHQVSMIVSRDTQGLGETDIARATVESVLENGSDAVFAAIFWFVILGAPGAVLYRLSNTLDAMWGYRNERYYYFGWAAARWDDAMNWIPARLTAFTYMLLGNGNARQAWRCWRLQAPTWYSPNAGPVMASGAGALGVLLGGEASYHGMMKTRPVLGTGRAPNSDDIERATSLVDHGVWVWIGLLLLGGWTLA